MPGQKLSGQLLQRLADQHRCGNAEKIQQSGGPFPVQRLPGSYWNIRARCSREVEHSDRNLAYLERALIRDKVFHMDDLLGFLGGGKIF